MVSGLGFFFRAVAVAPWSSNYKPVLAQVLCQNSIHMSNPKTQQAPWTLVEDQKL